MAEHNQQFDSFQEWVGKAPSWLCRAGEYADGFRAICFDTKGRWCTCGSDFMRARDEGAFPVRWLWPSQVPAVFATMLDGLIAAQEVQDVALPKFDWGRSCLDAAAIGVLNTAPRRIRKGLASATLALPEDAKHE